MVNAVDWGSWTNDSTLGATINDNNSDQSGEISLDGYASCLISLRGTYSTGTYDQPAIAYVTLETATNGQYQEHENAYDAIPLNGASNTSFNVVFKVSALDALTFRIDVDNQSGLNLSSVDMDYVLATIST